jgi:hypothetical protein
MYRCALRNTKTGKTSFCIGTLGEIERLLAYHARALVVEPDPYNPPGFAGSLA